MVMYGTALHWVIALIVYYMFGCWGVAITYHRLISHKSFTAPVWFKYIGMILGTLGGVGSTIQWTAVHREHHRYTDSDKDPHNPAGSIQRFIQMQFFSMLVPAGPKTIPDLLRDSTHVNFHKYYWLFHASYGSLLYFIDPFSIVYAYLIPCFVLWHVMSSLGTFAHNSNFGYRNQDTNDNSRNLIFLGWMAFGEGWHNNHHACASDFKFGKKPLEVDLSSFIIKLIKLN